MRVLKPFLWITVAALPMASRGTDISGRILLSGKPAVGAVVSIEGLRHAVPPDRSVHVIDHRDLQFVPRLLIGQPGVTVQFKNSDGMPCRIYSVSPSGIFVLRGEDSKPMAMTFDHPGVIQVRCSQHARIHAFVVIKDNPYFAQTDSKGRYMIRGVPPGRYTLQAWREGVVLGSELIDLIGARLKLDIRSSLPQVTATLGDDVSTQSENPTWRQE